MSTTLAILASVVLIGAPVCPEARSQSECDAIWAATHAVAATQNLGADRSASAGAAAYLAAQSAEPATILPPAVRMRLLYQVTDLLSQMAGTSVVLKKVTYFTNGGLICGTGLFGDKVQSFYSVGTSIKRPATAQQMEAAGCARGGGVMLANY